MYFDLNIQMPSDHSSITSLSSTTIELLAYSIVDGYKVLAVSSKVDNIGLSDKKILRLDSIIQEVKSKIEVVKSNILGSNLQDLRVTEDESLQTSDSYILLNRATFEFKDKKDVHTLNNIQDLSHVDILAINVKNESIFEFVCNEVNCEIISISCLEKINFYSKKKQILHAIDRGIYFEFNFSELINSETTRSIFIYNFTLLCEITKGKHIIVSSGSSSFLSQRSPYDVIVMIETLFNVSSTIASSFVISNPKQAIEKGVQRKFFKNAIIIKPTIFSTSIRDQP